MNITKLEIRNFRGLSDVSFAIERPVTVIVGPNAIGKTTVLEAVRLLKAVLLPRYFEETQQVLQSLGAVSPHPFRANYLDYSALARDPGVPVEIAMDVKLNDKEVSKLKQSVEEIAIEELRGQLARTDEAGQFALTQFLSSAQGKAARLKAANDARAVIDPMTAGHVFSLKLTLDPRRGMMGGDSLTQTAISVLEKTQAPAGTLFSYFPADRAFPSGEVNIQLGSAEAGNQMQAHMGQALSKYQRLKQTVVNNIIASKVGQPEELRSEFELIFKALLPGKNIQGLAITQVGTLRVEIREEATGKVFDIDHMSSGEKGLVLTFLLLRRTIASGGIVLIDEPELHLNPAVCKKLIPFMCDQIVAPKNIQVLICTHSGDILGSAFDRSDCGVYHLRSHKDATRVYGEDRKEMFEALRRLGTSPADSLFARGSLFVEGEHDAAVLEEGFFELLSGWRITRLGGRAEVEKEIKALQEAEKRKDLDKIHAFVFDLDGRPTEASGSAFVRVLQWDRYCLENYLLGSKALFDAISQSGSKSLGSRGEFESTLKQIVEEQLIEASARAAYSAREPDNPGIRPAEFVEASFETIADRLVTRLLAIKATLHEIDRAKWIREFVDACGGEQKRLRGEWASDWVRHCNGKRVFDALFRRFQPGVSKLELKRKVVRIMGSQQSDEWKLVRSKMQDAIKE